MLSERIKELRLSRCLNQVEFAKKLGVTKQSVSNWENNNIQPSIEMLLKLTELFSVSADYLLGIDNKKTLDVTGLSDTQLFHIQSLIDDIKSK